MRYSSKAVDGKLVLTLRMPPWLLWAAVSMAVPFLLGALAAFASGEAGAGGVILFFCVIPALLIGEALLYRERWTFDREGETAIHARVLGLPLWKSEHRLKGMKVVHVSRLGQRVMGLVLDAYPVRIRGPELTVNQDRNPHVSWRMAMELADYLDLPIVDGSMGVKRRPARDVAAPAAGQGAAGQPPSGASPGGRVRVAGGESPRTFVLPRPGLTLGDGVLLLLLALPAGYLGFLLATDPLGPNEMRIWIPIAGILAFLAGLAAILLRAALLRETVIAGPQGLRVVHGLLLRRTTTAGPGEITHAGQGLKSGNDLRGAVHFLVSFLLTLAVATMLSALTGRKGELDVDAEEDVSGDGVVVMRGPRHWIEIGRRLKPAERGWVVSELRDLLKIPLPPEPRREEPPPAEPGKDGAAAAGAPEGGKPPARKPLRPRRR